MQVFACEIVADAKNIELDLFRTAEQRRAHLVEYFNGHVAAGGLSEDVDPVPDDESANFTAMMIEECIGRTVLLTEARVW